MPHIIKKQVIDLTLGKKHQAFRMQHLMSDHYRNEIVPLLESVFDEFCGEDVVLVLDKLEIDLGLIPEKEMEKIKWDQSFLAEFKMKVREELSSRSASRTSFRESRSMNICRQWIFYMRHGYLNWNSTTVNEQWYESVLETLAIDFGAISSLRRLILEEIKTAYRIVLQHDEIFLTKLTEILTARNQNKLIAALTEIETLFRRIKIQDDGSWGAAPGFKKDIWQLIIVRSASAKTDLPTEAIIAILLEKYAGKIRLSRQAQKTILSSVKIIKKALAELFERQNKIYDGGDLHPETIKSKSGYPTSEEDSGPIQKPEKSIDQDVKSLKGKEKENAEMFKQKNDDKQEAEVKKNGRKKTGEENEPEKGEVADDNSQKSFLPVSKAGGDEQNPFKVDRTEDRSVPERKEEKKATTDRIEISDQRSLSETIPEEGIFITHAGIALVHPFLGHLFRRLQLVIEKQFTDREAQKKAVYLLHYCATGKTTADEFELVLCKLLCAYPLEEPISSEVALAIEEMAEADDMLIALIQQWSKLKNTSIAGLREGFLQRSGKLFVKKDLPHLQVESHAIDVLLDYLPWNLSMIRLPWMSEMLKVEWR